MLEVPFQLGYVNVSSDDRGICSNEFYFVYLEWRNKGGFIMERAEMRNFIKGVKGEKLGKRRTERR